MISVATKKNNFLSIVFNDRVTLVLILVGLISYFRNLFVPLVGDEITYYKIASNILEGKYYQNKYPSTVIPIIPFLMAFFKTTPLKWGLIIHKLFNLSLFILGLRYLILTLRLLKISTKNILIILLLTIVNSNSVAWFSNLYPEAILFFGFWGFIYHYFSDINYKNLVYLLLFFVLMSLTRYLYLILGIFLVFYLVKWIKKGFSYKRFFITALIVVSPILFWFKYVYHIELNNQSEISYFNRFKNDTGLFYNIKCGLGLEKHYEVSRINGIPAFANLFIPKTGFRSFPLSIIILIFSIGGYWLHKRKKDLLTLLLFCVLPMLGLVFSGTGFSRYWLIFLPIYILGFIFTADFIKINYKWLRISSLVLAGIYIINEYRINYMVLSELW